MENCLWQFPTRFSTLIHTLTTLRQKAKVTSENAGGAKKNQFILICKTEEMGQQPFCWNGVESTLNSVLNCLDNGVH
jgi:hypothetical protein